MSTLTAASLIPSKLNNNSFLSENHDSMFSFPCKKRITKKKDRSFVTVARLFGPSIFEASKLKVLFLGVDEKKHPGKLPRTYTFTHCDLTSNLTLAVSETINNSQLQGWYNKLQRDEVVAEWKKVKGNMSLHVHCHISGGHFLLDLVARFRYFIFYKELPLVLKAFVHGDGNLFTNYPELKESLVWVYFHSNIPEYNKVECWGRLKEAGAAAAVEVEETQKLQIEDENEKGKWEIPKKCEETCHCCFPQMSLISWSEKITRENQNSGTHQT